MWTSRAPSAAQAAASSCGARPLTRVASVSCSSAPSTSVQAAAFTTTSCPGTAAATAVASVTSRSLRVTAVTSSPAAPRTSTRSRPSMPDAPVTSHRTRSAPSAGEGGPGPQRLPPAPVLLVPRHGPGQAFVEGHLRRVPELARDLGDVHGVAPVVALAILDALHGVPAGVRGREQPLGQLGVGELGAAADVVDLAGPAALEDEVDAAAVVVDVQPVAHVEPVAVQRDRSPIHQV